MNEETFNLSIRKFLKTVGIGSQREIEQAVRTALSTGALAGSTGSLPATMTLEVAGVSLKVVFEGSIDIR